MIEALVLATATAALATIDLHAPKAMLHVEVARTEAEREHGLMDRRSLPAHTGMLFVFTSDEPVAFWMKDTLISLDMVFIDARGRVRLVAPNVATPQPNVPDEQLQRIYGKAEYVLELPAGEATDDGLTAGAYVRGLPAVPITHAP
ncbi:MAG: DUF192 domain-containing protein [Candidatus Eremiobacteraeota bacterium]|nr:DUF192 domain-containing protein [Candidatus Eremiobacteraeota bacterium]